jgi:hypothetical protein
MKEFRWHYLDFYQKNPETDMVEVIQCKLLEQAASVLPSVLDYKLKDQARILGIAFDRYIEPAKEALAKEHSNPVALALWAQTIPYATEEEARRACERLTSAIIDYFAPTPPVYVLETCKYGDDWYITVSTLSETGRWERVS